MVGCIMKKKILSNQLNETEQIPLFFALGKAYEDLKNFKLSFENYKKANLLKRKNIDYNFNQELDEFKFIKNEFGNFKGSSYSNSLSSKQKKFVLQHTIDYERKMKESENSLDIYNKNAANEFYIKGINNFKSATNKYEFREAFESFKRYIKDSSEINFP